MKVKNTFQKPVSENKIIQDHCLKSGKKNTVIMASFIKYRNSTGKENARWNKELGTRKNLRKQTEELQQEKVCSVYIYEVIIL